MRITRNWVLLAWSRRSNILNNVHRNRRLKFNFKSKWFTSGVVPNKYQIKHTRKCNIRRQNTGCLKVWIKAVRKSKYCWQKDEWRSRRIASLQQRMIARNKAPTTLQRTPCVGKKFADCAVCHVCRVAHQPIFDFRMFTSKFESPLTTVYALWLGFTHFY